MEKKTPEELLREAPVREGSVMAGLGRSELGKAARVSRVSIEKCLDDARRSGNIDRILGAEAIILRTELEIHANSRAMRTSLETSIAELSWRRGWRVACAIELHIVNSVKDSVCPGTA